MEEPVSKRACFALDENSKPAASTSSVAAEPVSDILSSTDEKRKASMPTKAPRAGFAAVKKEYLLTDVQRTLRTGFVSAADQKSLAETSEQVEKRGVAESLEQQDGADGDGNVEGKANKLRGRNHAKHRYARNRPAKSDIRICYQICQSQQCSFGDKCRYSHDLAGYMAQKPKDLDGKCPIFDRFKYCPYGVTCRFSLQHLDDDKKNMKQDDFTSLRADEANWLTEEATQKFRKKQFQFVESSRGLKEMNERLMRNKKAGEDEHVNECLKRDRDQVKKMDVKDKLYLAPLTTVGNLPFRRLCVEFGAEVTCGEMAMSLPLLQGNKFEWSHVRRHKSEKYFGVQICGNKAEQLSRTTELLNTVCDQVDFIDLNCGCPIDMVYKSGCGSALLAKPNRLCQIAYAMSSVSTVPISIKLRTGVHDGKANAHTFLTQLYDAGAACISLHGRSREQRYSRLADWSYIRQCSEVVQPYISDVDSSNNKFAFIGNGDILSYQDFYDQLEFTKASNILIARGALIKPWLFTEIRERRHWDISAGERLDMLKRFANYGLEHWGSDDRGVTSTRKFLLEWLSFTHRYIPVGLLERVPQKINEQSPWFCGRSDLETLLASRCCEDWIKISEMLLGKVPADYEFLPKHKANAYQVVPAVPSANGSASAVVANGEDSGIDGYEHDTFMPEG